MRDLGLVVVRGVVGGLVAAHGAQKLFGAFDGPGLEETAGFMKSLGLRPSRLWGTAAAMSEFAGGALTALGLLYPIGPIGIISSMTMATFKAHWGKPIWVTAGGAELPITNIAIATGLILTGPGVYALDSRLGLKLPRSVAVATMVGAAGMVTYGMLRPAPSEPATEEGRTTAPGGEPATESELPGDLPPISHDEAGAGDSMTI